MDHLATFAKTTGKLIWLGLCRLFRLAPGWSGTVALHLVILIGLIGIPSCSPKDHKPVIIPIEMLPIGTIDNLPQEQKAPPPSPKPTKPDNARPKPTPEPPKPEPVREPEPAESEPAPEAVPEKAKSPIQRIRNKPKPPPKPKPKEVEKPKPKKEVKKPDPKPNKQVRRPSKQDQKQLDSMLDDLLDDSKKAKQGQKAPQTAKLSISQQTALLGYIGRELKRNWINPFGGRQSVEAVELKIHLNPDGSLSKNVEIIDMSRYNSDPTFRALADSAKRAAIRAAPFKELPLKYADFYGTQWTYLDITFDPNE